MKLPNHIYHLAEASNWPSIQRDGLLSTSSLLKAAGLTGAGRNRLERAQRLTNTALPNQMHIRDQRPMPPTALESCLCGMGLADWYAMINARVFLARPGSTEPTKGRLRTTATGRDRHRHGFLG